MMKGFLGVTLFQITIWLHFDEFTNKISISLSVQHPSSYRSELASDLQTQHATKRFRDQYAAIVSQIDDLSNL